MELTARDIEKSFGSLQILKRTNLQVAAGQAVAIRGENGAGKTTLLRCLAGVSSLDAGTVTLTVDGTSRTPSDIQFRAQSGMLLEETYLYDDLTLAENLRVFGDLYAVPSLEERIRDLLTRLSLARAQSKLVQDLSYGMRRKVSIARALLHEPSLLFLDEPFRGLDSRGRECIAALLAERARAGGLVLFSTHEEALRLDCPTRELCLQHGELALGGSQ